MFLRLLGHMPEYVDVNLERIRALGGAAKSDVTKRTTYLVVGEDPGSKLARAREMGIAQINETELLSMLENET